MLLLTIEDFHTSFEEAVQATIEPDRPLLVFLSSQETESNDLFNHYFSSDGVTDGESVSFLRNQFVLLFLGSETLDYDHFVQIFPKVLAPAICIIRKNHVIDMISQKIQIREFMERILQASKTANRDPINSSFVQSENDLSYIPSSTSGLISSRDDSDDTGVTPMDLQTSLITSQTDIDTKMQDTSSICTEKASHSSTHRPQRLNNDFNESSDSGDQNFINQSDSNKLREFKTTNSTKENSSEYTTSLLSVVNKFSELNNMASTEQENSSLKGSSMNNKTSREETVQRHTREVKAQRRRQAQEIQRLRTLLEFDRKEMALHSKPQQNEEPNIQTTVDTVISCNDAVCILCIKFFDGSSIRHTFESSQTLDNVRLWLDHELGITIIPSNDMLPSFASSSYTQPIHYVFHLPTIPRTTYTSQEEFSTLQELGLCPRSALILKPIYEDPTLADACPEGLNRDSGFLASICKSLGVAGGALFSFFDYGALEDYSHSNTDLESDSDGEGCPSGAVDIEDAILPLSPTHVLAPSTAGIILIEPHRPPSQLNHAQEDSPGREHHISRPETPKILMRPGVTSRVLGFDIVMKDRNDKDTESYNGNTVNLDKKKDED